MIVFEGCWALVIFLASQAQIFEEFDTLDANDMLLLRECMQVPHPSMTVGGKRHLQDQKNPYYGCGARGCEKSGSDRKHTDRLPKFGPQGCVKP